MKQVLYLLFLLFLLSCSKDDDSSVVIENSLEVNINGAPYTVINENFGGNENCGILYVNGGYYEKDEINFHLGFSIKDNGELFGVRYSENVANTFLTPNFNPLSSFSIENFEYDPSTLNISFDFSGTVFLENQEETTRELFGNVDITSYKSLDCHIAKTGVEYFSNAINLVSYSGDHATKFADQTQRHRYMLNNGHIMEIYVEEDFWNLPIGQYTFDEISVMNKVVLYKYIGDLTANQTQDLYMEDWEQYDTRGGFSIEEKTTENGHYKVIGTIDMEVLNEGQVIYDVEGLEFSAASFED